MALLTREAEQKIIDLLLNEGLVDPTLTHKIQEESSLNGVSVLSELASHKLVSDGMIAHATALIMGVPYVELKNIEIDQDILAQIPQEACVRVLAVPLGEKDGMLNVAMVDVTNVQATDYLSNLINRPIRVWMSSERGIREVLAQYHGDFSGVKEAVKETDTVKD